MKRRLFSQPSKSKLIELSLLILLLQSDNFPWTVQSNTLKLPVSQSEAEIIYSGGRDMGAVKKGVIP